MDERVFPNIGILRVAACLEREGYPVEHLDLNGIENYTEATVSHVLETKANIFGLTATTPQNPAATKIVKAIRSVRPKARIILGGPHVTLVNTARKSEEKAGIVGRGVKSFKTLAQRYDVLVAGDGEDAIFGAISPDPPKLIDADDVTSALFLTNQRYNDLPLPARHLIDMDSYHYSIEGHKASSLIAQLGCPYMCSFCGGRNSPMLRRIRTRTTENIVAEIRHLYEAHGFTGHMLYDDELNVNKSIVELMNAIADLQTELGVEFRLRGFIKSNLFTDEQAAAMKRAGFRWILVGFESGSPRILENIQKKATREQNSECMAIARRHGLKVKALMSVGHAGESAETIAETKAWLLQEKPDDFDCTVITTYPGTPYFDQAVETSPGIWTFTAKNGDRLHAYETDFDKVADYYKGDPDGGYKAYVYTDHLSAAEIVKLRDELEDDVRRILNIPFNPGQPGIRFEASMGQLPAHILRSSAARELVAQ